VFEADEALTFTGPSDLIVGLPADQALFQSVSDDGQSADSDMQSVLLALRAAVKTNDSLLLIKDGWTVADYWAVASVQGVAPEAEPDGTTDTRVVLKFDRLKEVLSDAQQPRAAPLHASDFRLMRATATALLWTMTVSQHSGAGPKGAASATGSAATAPPAQPSSQTFELPLASLVRAVVPGDNVLFLGSVGGNPNVEVLAQVIACAEEVTPAQTTPPLTVGALPVLAYIPHTVLTLVATGTGAGDLQNAATAVLKTATTSQSTAQSAELAGIVMHYGFRDVGTLIPTPAKGLDLLPPSVTVPEPLASLPAVVALEGANGIGRLVQTTGSGSTLELAPLDQDSTAQPHLTAPIRMLADLVQVSRGTSVRDEILGDGDPTAAHQVFTLQHAPLIYLPPRRTGGDPISTLSVTVNGVGWDAVTAFAGQAPDARVYVVRTLPDGHSQILFGDGIDGARLPAGTGNVKASYRYGEWAQPPPPGSLTTVLQPQPGLASVRNPVVLTPGIGPEGPSETAQAAPAAAAMLSPAGSTSAAVITPEDCEQIARTVSGVTRVKAYWSWDPDLSRPAIVVSVAGADAGTTTAVIPKVKQLLSGVAERFPVSVRRAHEVGLAISCQLAVATGAKSHGIQLAAIKALINPATGLFSAARMAIGQRLYWSQVEAAVAVSGVDAVLGLRIELADAAGGQGASGSTLVFDPGSAGYFGVPKGKLTIGAVLS
jgi:hypothetical protein